MHFGLHGEQSLSRLERTIGWCCTRKNHCDCKNRTNHISTNFKKDAEFQYWKNRCAWIPLGFKGLEALSMVNVGPDSLVRLVLSKGLLYRIVRCTLTRQDLFATSWSIELLNRYFQDRHFRKAYDPTWITVSFFFINTFLKIFFDKEVWLRNWQCCLKRTPRDADIFDVLPLASAWGRTHALNVLFLN